MKNIKLLLSIFLLVIWLIPMAGKADDIDEIRHVAQRFYSVNERMLQCRTKEDNAFDPTLIHIPENLFSEELFSLYRIICVPNTSNIFIPFDIRTGDPQMHFSADSQVLISKIHIGKPDLSSKIVIVRATYDLDVASFKQWGNFTDLKFVKEKNKWRIDDIQLGGSGVDRDSYTGLIELKSLKQFLKGEVAKSKKKPH